MIGIVELPGEAATADHVDDPSAASLRHHDFRGGTTTAKLCSELCAKNIIPLVVGHFPQWGR